MLIFDRRCWAALAAVILSVGAHSCASSSSAGLPPTQVDLGPPKPLPPALPGYLAVGPSGLQLAVGATTTVWARLYDSAGAAQTADSVTWTSLTPSVLSVGTAGQVKALAIGEGELTATDGAHGTWLLQVLVTDAPASGPTGITFEPPVVAITASGTSHLAYTVTDAAGAPISPPPRVAFATSAPAAVSVSPAGDVTGMAPGISIVTATVEGQPVPLDGGAIVRVPGSGGSTSTQVHTLSSTSSGGPPPVWNCIPEFPPTTFSKPGVCDSLPLSVWVCRDSPTTGVGNLGTCALQAPDIIKAEQLTSAVLSAGPCAATVGMTRLHEYVGGVECTPEGGIQVDVSPDLAGPWSSRCGNGDAVSFDVAGWPTQVNHAPLNHVAYAGGASHMVIHTGAETSCATSNDGSFTCTSPADFGIGGASFTGFSMQTIGACLDRPGGCTGNPFLGGGTVDGLRIDDCAVARHTEPWRVISSDTLAFGDCMFTRGSSTCSGNATPTSGCDGTYAFSVAAAQWAGLSCPTAVPAWKGTLTIKGDAASLALEGAAPAKTDGIIASCTSVHPGLAHDGWTLTPPSGTCPAVWISSAQFDVTNGVIYGDEKSYGPGPNGCSVACDYALFKGTFVKQ
jgi:hypothetical protein